MSFVLPLSSTTIKLSRARSALAGSSSTSSTNQSIGSSTSSTTSYTYSRLTADVNPLIGRSPQVETRFSMVFGGRVAPFDYSG